MGVDLRGSSLLCAEQAVFLYLWQYSGHSPMLILKIVVMYRFSWKSFSDTVSLHTNILAKELSSSVFFLIS